METKIAGRLQSSSKKQLVLLVQELTVQHPELLSEVQAVLDQLANLSEDEEGHEYDHDGSDEQHDDEWDISKELATMDFVRAPAFPPIDIAAYHQRIEGYLERIKQKKSLQPICDDLFAILKEAQQRADHEDYYNALDLYALVIDECLADRNATLTSILDKALNETMPMLQAVLLNVCSCIIVTSSSFLTPVLTPEMRYSWVERLFSLWLKRLDRYHVEEDVPEILLEMAWENDLSLLRRFVQEELQRLRQNGTSNIVDFARQSRARTLEKFLKELP